jgi:hypothetical protein
MFRLLSAVFFAGLISLAGCTQKPSGKQPSPHSEGSATNAFPSCTGPAADSCVAGILTTVLSTGNVTVLEKAIGQASPDQNMLFLFQSGFATGTPGSFTIHPEALAGTSSKTVEKLLEKLEDTAVPNRPLIGWLTIAGTGLHDKKERDRFITGVILKSNSSGVHYLTLFSNLIKQMPESGAVKHAFSETAKRANREIASGFLNQTGYFGTSPKMREYDDRFPEKLSHLPPEAVAHLIKAGD